jgi:hypothetical protein
MQFSRQKLGHTQIIGIHGPNKQIVQQYHWLFLNHGATLRDPYWLVNSPIDNYTCIFPTTLKKLKNSFLSMERIKLETELDDRIEYKRIGNNFKKNKSFGVDFLKRMKYGAEKRMTELIERTDLYFLLRNDGVKMKDL